MSDTKPLTRRSFLMGAGATSLVACLPIARARANPSAVFRLIAKPGEIGLLGNGQPLTDVWAYNGKVPGPELRYVQGDRLDVAFENELDQASTVHWHGIRLPNSMDGVPGLTQAPVGKGESFLYSFDLLDAGTYWYHPHVKSSVQIGRGLYGPLIVDEKTPPQVDRDVTWVLDDWRIDDQGQIDGSFYNMHDMSHAGRLGNLASLNGVRSHKFEVRSGERIRLRLINVANARNFALGFGGHNPQVIALDGHPVEPFSPKEGRVELGAGQRADLIVDMTGEPGDEFAVVDTYYPRSSYHFLNLVYEKSAPVRENLLNAPIRLDKNPIPDPDYSSPLREDVVISGGAMGGMRGATYQGNKMAMRELVGQGKVWAINGIVADPDNRVPMFRFERGGTYQLIFRNDTA